MTNKIRIQNVKTGKISEVTQFAWQTLKKGGKSKFYEVLNKPSEPVKFKMPIESKPVQPEPEVDQVSDIELESESESIDEPEVAAESAPVRKKRKPKN